MIFEQCKADPCVFRFSKEQQVTIMVLVHVDDTIVAAKGDDANSLCKHLNSFFPTNNLGEITHYMGCSFKRNRSNGTLKMSQEAFVSKFLDRFNISNTCPIPACPSVELLARREEEDECKEPFREAVGGLMWLADMTRPDIANAVRDVACHADNPLKKHWKAVMGIMKYLKGTANMGRTFCKDGSRELVGLQTQHMRPIRIPVGRFQGGRCCTAVQP